jgi:hypothetical protein
MYSYMHFYVLELGQAITTMADELGFSSRQEQESMPYKPTLGTTQPPTQWVAAGLLQG